MEMMMLKEDLEWNDDLNDDMFNEIQRFERNVERERLENEKLLLKGKSRKAEIELLRFRLLNEFGIEPPKKAKPKKIKGRKCSPNSKQKDDENGDEEEEMCEGDEEDYIEEKVYATKSSAKRGFTAIVKDWTCRLKNYSLNVVIVDVVLTSKGLVEFCMGLCSYRWYVSVE